MTGNGFERALQKVAIITLSTGSNVGCVNLNSNTDNKLPAKNAVRF